MEKTQPQDREGHFRVDSYKFCPAARESYQRFPEQPGVVPPAPVRVPPARA
ncbi:MAG: hypothetical protein HYX97_05875, partial [Chloroflexi bacterium]|nr:hypothetical protein [Chloroflexota bacterium]